MNEDRFTQLLELVQSAGAGGSDLLIFWLVLDFVSPILMLGMIMISIVWLGNLIWRSQRCESVLQNVAGLVGCEYTLGISAYEAEKIIQAIINLKTRANQVK